MNKRPLLIADKELFRLWYEFYKLSLQSDSEEIKRALRKSAKFYKDWEVKTDQQFDDWWSGHRYLFERKDIVRVLNTNQQAAPGSIILEISAGCSTSEVISEIRRVLPRSRSDGVELKYLPTEIRGVKRESLRMMLDLERRVFSKTQVKGWDLYLRVKRFFESERFKRKQNRIPQSFFVDWKINAGENSENAERNLRRYRQKVKKLILNVASGQFPGKY